MSRLEHAAEVADLAADLGLDGAADPVDAILHHCRTRIDRWVAEAGGVAKIAALEALVIRKLQMVFEEVWSDADFDRITEKYARGKKDPVFATMRLKFDDPDNPTYGALVKRRNAALDAPDRYVAVIDCRGYKALRRFFTRWHEIAHRLTTDADEPQYRSEHDPIERLMDEIAGHVGFYGPLFDPVFKEAQAGKALLTFQMVQAVQDGGFPEASFQATLNSCAKRLPTPVVYLEAMMAHKKEVKRRLQTPSMFGDDRQHGELRAVKVIPNVAAQEERFTIPTNMRVPEASVIHRLFLETASNGPCQEDLCWWESQGRKLEGRAVAVEARSVADRVIAIVQPVEPIRPKVKRPEPKSLFAE